MCRWTDRTPDTLGTGCSHNNSYLLKHGCWHILIECVLFACIQGGEISEKLYTSQRHLWFTVSRHHYAFTCEGMLGHAYIQRILWVTPDSKESARTSLEEGGYFTVLLYFVWSSCSTALLQEEVISLPNIYLYSVWRQN